MTTRRIDQPGHPDATGEPVAPVSLPVSSARPHPWEMLLLAVAVPLPEGIIVALIAVALPLFGPAINVPADAVIDWAFVGIAACALLGIFRRATVAEHHGQVCHPGRIAGQQRLLQC